MLSLHYISRDEYNNADASSKTSDKLFFLSDTHEIFRGTENFTESVIFYDEEPTTKIAGKLYINQNTLVGRIWNGIDWITVAEPQVQSDYENNDNTSKSFILNRPFYDSRNTISRTYGFDGSTNGKTVLNTADANAKYIKVSDDLILNKDILVGGTLVSVAPNSEGTGTEESSISIDQVYTINANESGKYVYALVSSIAPYVLVAKEDCSFIDVYSSDSSSINITAGVYFLYQAADNYVKSLTFSYESGELKTIDPKFIPWESSPAATSVLYTEQTLTDEQKAQARTNIGAGGPQVQSDYTQNDNTQTDYIKNRPFYEDASVNIIWDGDTTDKTSVSNVFYLVSSDTPSVEDLIGCTLTVHTNSGEENSEVITETMIAQPADNIIGLADTLYVALEDGAVYGTSVFPTKGTYFLKYENAYIVSLFKGTLKKLDPKFIDMNSLPKEVLKITVTYDSSTDTYSADKTSDDIKTCLDNGGIPYVYFTSGYNEYTLTGYSADLRCYCFSNIHSTMREIDIHDSGDVTVVADSKFFNNLEYIDNKVTAIDNTATNRQYPSALAVKTELDKTIKITEQTLTDEQKTQARTNIGAGAPQVQSDYTQNDNTQSDHIKNRPFYEDASISIEWDGDTADKTQVWSIDNHEVNENLLIKSFTSASSSVVSGKLVIFAIKPETPSAFDTTDYSAILYNETTGSLCEITLVSASNGSNLNHPSGVLQFRHKVIGSKGDVYTFRAWIVDPDGKVSANSMTKNITIR